MKLLKTRCNYDQTVTNNGLNPLNPLKVWILETDKIMKRTGEITPTLRTQSVLWHKTQYLALILT